MRLILAAAVLAAGVSLTGILAMTGVLRGLVLTPLSAEVHLTDYPLPTGFGLEPQIVADFLTDELTTRAKDNIALRLALGTDGQKKLIEIAIPRLVSSAVVRDMIKNIKPLANVLSVGEFRLAARVVVVNRGDARSDVALTLPGAILAEAATGSAEIEATSTGLTAVKLGDMAAGETRLLWVWMGQGAVDAGAGFGKQVLLGDAGGTVGRVWVYGQGAWQGADLQAMPAARWMVGGVLVLVFIASVLVFLGLAMTWLRVARRRISPA